ncbi:DNA helicase B isoform X5 [Canis aureus]
MVAVRCPGFPGSEETREGAAMALVRQPLRELQGPLLPPKNLEDEDEDCVREDAEDDEDLEFVDAEELCGGGVKAGTLPGRVRVIISDENTQEQCNVFGRFPIMGPWWRVKVQVRPMGLRSYQVHGFPSYFLQSDMSPPNQKSICSLFLRDCNFSSDKIDKFLAWVNAVSSYKNLNFENLREMLRLFQKETERKGQKQSTQDGREESLPENEMCLPLENKVPFITVMTALQFPKIMEFLPILLPRHFKWLISSGSKELLEKIEEMLGTHPWKLGFSKIKPLARSRALRGSLLQGRRWPVAQHSMAFVEPVLRGREPASLGVNYSFYLWEKKNSAKNGPWKFSSVRVLVVDEGSLVSVRIFKSVLKLLCEHSKLSKLIILGDIRQLPSIEPGNLLIDLFETLKSRNCAIELKTNHRTESELIVNNATRISRRQFPVFDAELNISDNPTLPISIQDKTFIFIRLPEEDVNSQLSKNDPHSHLYSAVRTLLKENDLQDAQTSQFIAFRRQDCDVINACCCKHYTGHLFKDHRNRLQFGVGDKICCTRNAYLSELLPQNTSHSQEGNDREASGEDFNGTPHGFAKNKHDFESDIRLCNGEIFFITQDVTDVTFGKRRFLTINNAAGLEITVDFEKLMKYCHIKHAWARTIHTFQGSEEKTVVYVVGKAGRQHWQHVYTAVTRGRCRVYIIAEECHLRSAILKNSVPRKTRLKHFLQNKLSMSCASPAEFAPLSEGSGENQGPSLQLSAKPLPPVPTNSVAHGVPESQASVAEDRTLAFPGEWKSSAFDEVDTEEDPSILRVSKRGCGLSDAESPSKIRMVGATFLPAPGLSIVNSSAPRTGCVLSISATVCRGTSRHVFSHLYHCPFSWALLSLALCVTGLEASPLGELSLWIVGCRVGWNLSSAPPFCLSSLSPTHHPFFGPQPHFNIRSPPKQLVNLLSMISK